MLEWLYCPLIRRTDAFISQCCRIATIPRRIRKSKMRCPPATLRPTSKVETVARRLPPAAIDLNVEVPDLLAQRVAVEPQEVGGADLVAAGCRECCGQERHLDLLEDAVIEAGRRHAVREAGEVRGQIGLDRTAEIV